MSISEGGHVIIKHPLLFKQSDVGIINKIDLQPVLEIDVDKMLADAYTINPDIQMFLTSAKTGQNVDELIAFLNLE